MDEYAAYPPSQSDPRLSWGGDQVYQDYLAAYPDTPPGRPNVYPRPIPSRYTQSPYYGLPDRNDMDEQTGQALGDQAFLPRNPSYAAQRQYAEPYIPMLPLPPTRQTSIQQTAGRQALTQPAWMQAAEKIEDEPPKLDCASVAIHAQSCPICAQIYKCDKSPWILAVAILALLCLLLLKIVLERNVLHRSS